VQTRREAVILMTATPLLSSAAVAQPDRLDALSISTAFQFHRVSASVMRSWLITFNCSTSRDRFVRDLKILTLQ